MIVLYIVINGLFNELFYLLGESMLLDYFNKCFWYVILLRK